MERVRLAAPTARVYKAGAASATSVAGLFAGPPSWLIGQLENYHKDPEAQFKPLCTAVADVVLGDALRWEEVRDEVERALAEEKMVF